MNPEDNPFQQPKLQLNHPPTLNTTSKLHNQKSDSLLFRVEQVLKKMAYKRSKYDNALLQQFIEDLPYLSQIAKCTSVDFAKHLLKDANIKRYNQGQVVCEHGKKIEKIYAIVQGGLGIVTSMHLSTNLTLHEQQLSKTLEDIMKKPKQNDFTYVIPITKPKLLRRNTVGMTDSLGFLGRQKKWDINELQFAKILNRGDSYGDICFANGNIYTDSVVSMTKSMLLTIKPISFAEGLAQYRKKKSAEQIQLFRSLSPAFNYFNNEKLSELITLSNIQKMSKGDYIFKQNEFAENIYILLQGELKITKNVKLFLQNPNIFYANRNKLIQDDRVKSTKDKYSLTPYMKKKRNQEEHLPYADFSTLYNYQPKNKIIQLGILADHCIFGEEEVFSNIPRQVSLQVATTNARFFVLSPQLIEKILNQLKSPQIPFPMQSFKSQLYDTISKQRILYRQKKLADILQIENKHQMDYFYIGQQEKKSPKKTNLIRINRAISVDRKTITTPLSGHKSEEEVALNTPMYHSFNFTKMLLSKHQKQDSQSKNMDQSQRAIAGKTHTVSLISQKVRQRQQRSKKMENDQIKPIDIKYPLFEQGFLKRKYKEVTRQDQAKIKANSYFKREVKTSRELYR